MIKFIGLDDEIKGYGEFYCPEIYAKVDIKYGVAKVTYLGNAMSKYSCRVNTIYSQLHDNILEFLNLHTVKDVAEMAHKDCFEDKYVVYHHYVKGYNVFDPFKEVKKQKLAKMTAGKFVKAVLAGQVKKVVCKGRYTDDYYDDDKRNYDKGKELDVMEFAKKMVEVGTKRWHVWFDDDKLTLTQGSWCSYEAEFVA